ncbi:MAG: hypothetical protein ABL997_07005 [Planctomycetota bacterium]
MPRAPWLLLVLAIAVAGIFWLQRSDPESSGHAPTPNVMDAPGPAPAPAAAEDQKEPAARTVIADDKGDGAFHSEDDDGQVLVDAVRDGIVIEVRDSNGAPCGGYPVKVDWRKGWGMYGFDRGRTEKDGTFATTVAQIPFFESFSVEHPIHGELGSGTVPIPTADDPRRVVYVLPRMAELRFVARDLAGAPFAGAKFELRASPDPLGLRENVLVPDAAEPARTDAEGLLTARLPTGIADVEVSVGDERPALEARVRVPPAGGEVDLVLPNPDSRHELRITVVRPEEAGMLQRIHAWGRSDLPRPRSPLLIQFESKQRDYEVHTASDGTFTAKVDALPFRIHAQSSNQWFDSKEVAANQREVQLVLRPIPPQQPKEPMAQIAVTVTGVDGTPASGAQVRLHLTPDLVYGSDSTADQDGKLVLTAPATGKTACVSARDYKLPFVLAGPVVLREGKQEVKLQLLPGGVIRVAVVNADGAPVKSDVLLRRPAGPLREMEGGGPEILPHSPSGDSGGTGESGTFDFDGIGPGVHEVWAFPDAGGLPARALASAGDAVTLRLGDGCDDVHLLEVQVVDADTGEVLPYVAIRVDGSIYTPVRDGERGPFRVPVRDGEVVITARAIDHVVQAVKFTARKGGPACTVRLEPSPLRFVRLVDENGIGMHPYELRGVTEAGEEIEFVDEHGNYEGSVVRTDRHGCATMRGLPRSGCTLIAEFGGETDGKRKEREFALPAGAGLDARFDLVWK